MLQNAGNPPKIHPQHLRTPPLPSYHSDTKLFPFPESFVSKTPWKPTLTLILIVGTSPLSGCDTEQDTTPQAQGTEEEPAAPAATPTPAPEPPPVVAWTLEAKHTVTPRAVELSITTEPGAHIVVREGDTLILEAKATEGGSLEHTLHPTDGHHKLDIEALEFPEDTKARAQTSLDFDFNVPPYQLDSVHIHTHAKNPQRRVHIACAGQLESEYGETLPACPKGDSLILTKRSRLHLTVEAQYGVSLKIGPHNVPFVDGKATLDEPVLGVLSEIKLADIEKHPTLSLPVTLTTRQRIFTGSLELERAPLAPLLIEALIKRGRFPRKPGDEGISLLYVYQRKDTWKSAGPPNATLGDLDRVAFAVDTPVKLRRCRENNKVRERKRLDLYVVIYDLDTRKKVNDKRFKATPPECPPYPWDSREPILGETDETQALAWVASYAGVFH